MTAPSEQKYALGLSPHGFHRIAYQVWGRPDAPRSVVCVHGLVRNAHDFDHLAAALAENLRVICVDIPGRGASDDLGDPAFYAYPQYLADMTALLARLDVTEVDWIGTSMGGLIGMLLAAQPRTPIRRLVLNDVGPFLSAAAIARIAAYVSTPPQFPDLAAAEAYLGKIYHHVGPCTAADRAAFARHSLRPLPGGGFRLRYDPGIAQNFAAAKTGIDLWPVYDRITCPTLVLRGALSDVLDATTAAAMTQRGPRAALVTIPDIGHFPALMDTHQTDIVCNFLNS
ncbi:MAG: alpha/beta hydrolase [Alphaproteobacteria bacterium]